MGPRLKKADKYHLEKREDVPLSPYVVPSVSHITFT